ncbi:serine hydrolase [Actinoplanes auranticolor]|uniref:Serine hydrolase n=1 Tax=Actinoplanes auranticolor TaxID=47988 RepID=A0A919SSQ2_9ACTN|nr:serine hydrolase [Actinoplanes auranticolor]GIM77660.1 serine hydrolase [Actinoplanes auranticolor]
MTRTMRIDDLLGLAVPGEPALAPDGAHVAYVLRTQDAAADRTVTELWVVPTAGGSARRLTAGPADTTPVWSPDGTRLAFLRGGRLAVLPLAGGDAQAPGDLPPLSGPPAWSPDGTRIAFTAVVREPAPADAPLVADRLDYQADGAGLVGAARRQVHVLDLETLHCRVLTDGPHDAGVPVWSPDGTDLAFVRALGDDSDLRFRAAVHLLAAGDRHAEPRVTGPVEGVARTAGFTADGTALLVVGWPADPVGHARLLRVPLDGAGPADLAGGIDRNVMPGGLAYPGGLPQEHDGRILFCVRDQGCTHLWSVAPDGTDPRAVVAGAGRVVDGLSVRRDLAAFVLSTPDSFGQIAVVDLAGGGERVLTRHGRDVALFPREERSFTISDGRSVQAWLIRDGDAPGPRPLLLDIHGGPHNAWNGAADEVHLYHQELVRRGWVVLLVNPRGSDGYGETFYDGATSAWGVADAADLLEPIDALVAEGVADPDRLAVTGYSYGGYLTCWLTGHDDRFAAAVAGGTVADLVSMAGTCDDGQFLSAYELGGPPWQDPKRYADMSPLTRVADVRTPTLLLHGADDLTCPAGQAQQWHTALRQLGVPTRLVLYPGASHAFILNGPPSQRLDYNRRVVDWLEQHTRRGGRAPLDAAHWQRRLARLAERHGVPGAQLGILRLATDPHTPDEQIEVSAGVLDIGSGRAVTPDALFQIGSVTKVWTATAIMQLADEGRLHLDTPVAELLPGFRLADPAVAARVTVRHLLTHTSGIDGDVFTDTGRGDDCLQRYVELLAEQTQNHPLGATWSYCNAGYTVLGRILEEVTGQTWDEALKQRLFTPLGLTATATLPEDVLLHPVAGGHVEHDGELAAAPVWHLPRSVGPAGLISANAADVLAFARLHLTGGRTTGGDQLLGAASAAAMAEHQVDLPDKLSLGDSWGLGWIRFGWDGHRIIGHDGNTIGQAAFLRLLPEQGLAVTLLTNKESARDLYQDLFSEVFAELAGVAMPEPILPPDEPAEVDVTPYAGTYERASVRIEVLAGDGDEGPRMRTTLTGPLAALVPDPVEVQPLVPVGPGLFLTTPAQRTTWYPVTFYELDSGERYVHFGARATPRVD